MGAEGGIDGLAFLVGTWRGAGVVRGTAVTSRSVCEVFGADMLKLDTETFRGAQRIHRERVLWRSELDGSVSCTTSPWRSKVQLWRVETVVPGRAWRHLHPGLRWELARAVDVELSGDSYDETFDVLGTDGVSVRVVTLRNERVASDVAPFAASALPPSDEVVLEEPAGDQL